MGSITKTRVSFKGTTTRFNRRALLTMSMTGTNLDDLKTVCTGKETYFRDAYCDQLDMVLLNAQGVNAQSGAVLL